MESSLQSCAVSRNQLGEAEANPRLAATQEAKTLSRLGLELYGEEMASPRPETRATQREAGTTVGLSCRTRTYGGDLEIAATTPHLQG